MIKRKKDKSMTFIKKHKTLTAHLIVLLVGIFFSLWLLKPGIINGHDMTFHLSRIKGLRDSIAVSDFRALIHVGLYGYGYANGLFYGNLLLYVPALVSLMGVNLINSYKVYVLFCTLLSAFTMYWSAKSITKSYKIGIFASFLYSACSYKCCDFIIRAAVGEIGSFIFIPIIILGLYELVYRDYKKWYLFSIGFVGLVQCHLISTVLAAILMAIFIIACYERLLSDKKRILYLIISAIVGLALGAYFILPLLQGITKNNMVVNLNSFPIWKMTVPMEKLFLGFPYYKSDPFIPAGIGMIFIVISVLRFKIKPSSDDKLMKFCDLSLIFAYVCLLCATDFFPWKEITFLQSVQFPWRLYLFSSLFFTFSCSIIVFYYLKGKKRIDKVKFLIPIIVVAIIPYLVTENYYRAHSNGGIFYNWDDYTVASGEYLPINTDLKKLKKRGEKVTSNNKNLKVDYQKRGNRVDVTYEENQDSDTYIEVPLLYYYGYSARDNNNKEYKITKGKNNVIRVYLPNEKGEFSVYYRGTTIQKYSVILSIIAWLFLCLYIVQDKRNKVVSRCLYEKRKN